jgi:hypothetical protein
MWIIKIGLFTVHAKTDNFALANFNLDGKRLDIATMGCSITT